MSSGSFMIHLNEDFISIPRKRRIRQNKSRLHGYRDITDSLFQISFCFYSPKYLELRVDYIPLENKC